MAANSVSNRKTIDGGKKSKQYELENNNVVFLNVGGDTFLNVRGENWRG